MAFKLGTLPRWYFVNENGTPLSDGRLHTYRSDNKQEAAIYLDPAGTIPYSNPATIDGDGTLGPIYWDDSFNYFIEVRKSPTVTGERGELVWSLDNYAPPSDGGGGSTVTTTTELKNLVVNNTFLYNINGGSGDPFGSDPSTVNVSSETDLVIAPSGHHGLTNPDIRFQKELTGNSDTITFLEFNIGNTPFSDSGNTDATPIFYLRYRATTDSGSDGNYKRIRIPLTKGVKNLEGKEVTVVFWARSDSATTITPTMTQYFGQGDNSPSAEVSTGAAESITTSWTRFTQAITLPDIGTKVIGNCGDDGVFLDLNLPVDTIKRIDIALPSSYVGTLTPEVTWQSTNEVASLISAPRTGDVRLSMNNHFNWGWVPANDGTIGSAPSNATTRNNVDTFPLYNLLWNNISNTYAPVTGGRGASAVADFAADKPIRLTRMLGRVLAGLNAPLSARSSNFTVASVNTGNNSIDLNEADTSDVPRGTPVYFDTTGSLPTGLTANTIYYVINSDTSTATIKLATSLDNAIAGTVIGLSGSVSGSPGMHSALGNFTGEGLHTLTIGEMPSHNHPGSTVSVNQDVTTAGGGSRPRTPGTATEPLVIANQGDGNAHNTMQPTGFVNVYLKL